MLSFPLFCPFCHVVPGDLPTAPSVSPYNVWVLTGCETSFCHIRRRQNSCSACVTTSICTETNNENTIVQSSSSTASDCLFVAASSRHFPKTFSHINPSASNSCRDRNCSLYYYAYNRRLLLCWHHETRRFSSISASGHVSKHCLASCSGSVRYWPPRHYFTVWISAQFKAVHHNLCIWMLISAFINRK